MSIIFNSMDHPSYLGVWGDNVRNIACNIEIQHAASNAARKH